VIEIESHMIQPGKIIDIRSAIVDQKTSCFSLMYEIGDKLFVFLSDIFFEILKDSVSEHLQNFESSLLDMN
jgi:hypothetical protein